MKRTYLPCLAGFFILAASTARAQEQKFQDFNCAITPPADMNLMSGVTQPGAVAAFRSADQKRVLIIVVDAQPGLPATLDDRFVKGMEEGVEKNAAAKFVSGKFITIDGLKYYERLGALDVSGEPFSTFWRTVIADGKLYCIQAMLNGGDASTDPALRKSIESFRFLTPPKPPIASEDPADENFSYRVGKITGFVLMGIFAVGMAIWAFRRNKA